MAKFFKDPNGKLIAALGNDVATPAGCTELTANTEDAAHEKHVPVVESERDGHVIRARVGSVEHPSLPEHYIEWIALEAEGRLEVHYLEPGMKPATSRASWSVIDPIPLPSRAFTLAPTFARPSLRRMPAVPRSWRFRNARSRLASTRLCRLSRLLWAPEPRTNGRSRIWFVRSRSSTTTRIPTMPPMPWPAPSATLTSAAPGRLPAASSINREEPDTDDFPAPWNACRGHDELGRCRCIGRGL